MKTITTDKDIILIEQVLRKDAFASRQLVERHQNYAFTIALRIVGNREEAEEAAQDAFVNMFKNLSGFNRQSKFTTWFYRIVVNAALSIRQKKKNETESLENVQILSLPQEREEEKSAKTNEQRHYIKAALQHLSPDDVTMITLFYLKELSLEEIADITQIEVNTIKVKLHRARKRMAEVLQGLLKGEEKSLF